MVSLNRTIICLVILYFCLGAVVTQPFKLLRQRKSAEATWLPFPFLSSLPPLPALDLPSFPASFPSRLPLSRPFLLQNLTFSPPPQEYSETFAFRTYSSMTNTCKTFSFNTLGSCLIFFSYKTFSSEDPHETFRPLHNATPLTTISLTTRASQLSLCCPLSSHSHFPFSPCPPSLHHSLVALSRLPNKLKVNNLQVRRNQ